MSDGRYLAHGIGGAKDLPIPPELAIAGAVAALTVSFTVLAVAWRSPRYDAATSGRPAPAYLQALVDAPALRVVLRVLGMAVFLYGAYAAVLGQDLLTNPVFGMFYVWWWVGLVPLSLLLGPVWKAISPVRTINLAFAKISGSDPDRGVFTYPERLGVWPAAIGLYAFVWMELVYQFSTELGPVRLWVATYVAVMLLGGALFGNTFYERADPFEVYSSLIAKLSPWGRRDGQLIVRSPLANLDSVTVRPGLVAVMAVLFGSTAYDSFRESSFWVRHIQSSETSVSLLNNLALLGFVVGVGVIFAVGTAATGVGPETPRWSLPDRFAHSVVPIIVGYMVAHYLTYLVEVGQLTLIQASDPLGTGQDLLGTGDWSVNYWLSYHPTLLANTKVLAVVLGHVVGVVAAHDRAIKLLPKRHQLTGQLPLLVAMVFFTAGGLYLLFAA
ncbi:hypothetical protein [Nocardioides deserti]|uniref:Fenitrothion hydrolase n=1 Tax=Nocardioides deserti TaxID=1588644 RepID=A0ABR6U966_9ACTN|nr:hypothetical protein [Nocardioides deserti]MBC2960474.1 hypothetical protein [Nocardioides deserti]GGO71278.1 hypothetical protein GCM10012276_11870 [Nocardioides deserti]